MVGCCREEAGLSLTARLLRDLRPSTGKHAPYKVILVDARTVKLLVGKAPRELRECFYYQVVASMMAHHGWDFLEATAQVQVTMEGNFKVAKKRT